MHSSKGDMARANSSLYNNIVSYNPGVLRFIKDISQQGFDIIQVEMYEYLYLGFILPKHVKKVFIHHELRFIRNKNEVALFKEQNPFPESRCSTLVLHRHTSYHQKKMPNFKLYVTGKWKEKELLPITRKNPEIEFVGYM